MNAGVDAQYVTNARGERIALIVPFESTTKLETIKTLLSGLPPQDLEEVYDAVLQMRAEQAIEHIRSEAKKRGLDRLSQADIDAEISAARAERHNKIGG